MEVMTIEQNVTITSLEVAEMVGRQHKEVLRDLRNITNQLAESKIAPSDYFKDSTYLDTNSQLRPSFNLTKKGCELFATRMTGTKGTQFAVAYIEKFNVMEQQLQQNLPQDPITLALRAALETREQVQVIQTTLDEVKVEVDVLRDGLYVTSVQAKAIRYKVAEKVYEALGGESTNAFKQMKNKIFSSCWRDFKDYFHINEYRELPRIKFDTGMKFLLAWQPSTALKMDIQAVNAQQNLFEGEVTT